MGILKPRHERFCRQFVECTNATVAAKVAGYRPSSARNAGYRLLRQPRIVGRIIELQRETAQTQCRDVDVLLGKLETIYRRAVDDHQLGAAARAVELQARLSGIAAAAAMNRRQAGPSSDADEAEEDGTDIALEDVVSPEAAEPALPGIGADRREDAAPYGAEEEEAVDPAPPGPDRDPPG